MGDKKIIDIWISKEMEEAGIEHNLQNVYIHENGVDCSKVCPLSKGCPIVQLDIIQNSKIIDKIENIVGCNAVLRCPVLLWREK